MIMTVREISIGNYNLLFKTNGRDFSDMQLIGPHESGIDCIQHTYMLGSEDFRRVRRIMTSTMSDGLKAFEIRQITEEFEMRSTHYSRRIDPDSNLVIEVETIYQV